MLADSRIMQRQANYEQMHNQINERSSLPAKKKVEINK